MVRQRKTPRTKSGKQRSLLFAILAGIGHLLGLFAGWTYRHARKNPLMACGFFLFLVGFGFVTFNALFYQSTSHHAVFIQTRPLAAQTAATASRNTPVKADQPLNNTPPAAQSASTQPQTTTPPSVAVDKTLPDNLLEAQKKLAAMGLYDGPIDGLDGPKTRSAITLWQQKTAQVGGQSGTLKQQDDIASLISGSLATAGNVDKVTTQSLTNEQRALTNEQRALNNEHKALTNEQPAPANQQPANKIATNANEMRVMSAAPQEISKAAPSQRLENQGGFKADTADIMRVQAGLRAFGDDHVVVTGTEDENTAEALKNFQKMFSLTVTGKINQEVIDKMKDIGLIG